MQYSNNLTTSVRQYSLYALANQALDAARAAWTEAYHRADQDPSVKNIRAFVEADAAMKAAEKTRDQVCLLMKYTHDTKRMDGSDTSMKQSLEDAGFGDFGPM